MAAWPETNRNMLGSHRLALQTPKKICYLDFKVITLIRSDCSNVEPPSTGHPKELLEDARAVTEPRTLAAGGQRSPESYAGWLPLQGGTVQCKTYLHLTFSPLLRGAWGQLSR